MVCCDSGKLVTDHFRVSQVMDLVVSKYKSKSEFEFRCTSNNVEWISWQFSSEERVPSLRHINEVLGAFVTAGARFHLCTYLDRLQD